MQKIGLTKRYIVLFELVNHMTVFLKNIPFFTTFEQLTQKKDGQPNDSIPIWIPCWVFCLLDDKPIILSSTASVNVMWIPLYIPGQLLVKFLFKSLQFTCPLMGASFVASL